MVGDSVEDLLLQLTELGASCPTGTLDETVRPLERRVVHRAAAAKQVLGASSGACCRREIRRSDGSFVRESLHAVQLFLLAEGAGVLIDLQRLLCSRACAAGRSWNRPQAANLLRMMARKVLLLHKLAHDEAVLHGVSCVATLLAVRDIDVDDAGHVAYETARLRGRHHSGHVHAVVAGSCPRPIQTLPLDEYSVTAVYGCAALVATRDRFRRLRNLIFLISSLDSRYGIHVWYFDHLSWAASSSGSRRTIKRVTDEHAQLLLLAMLSLRRVTVVLYLG